MSMGEYMFSGVIFEMAGALVDPFRGDMRREDEFVSAFPVLVPASSPR